MYKTELHCHSKDASPCSEESAESLIEIYEKAGYSTVILTNHYSNCVYDAYNYKDINEYVDVFTGAYDKMKDLANGRLTVLMGAELRFRETPNDYLCFGIDEEYMRNTPQIFDYSIKDFHNICKEKGWLFIQAHPFRNGMQIVKPEFLDGIEVYNGHTGHQSRNFLARAYAEEYGLLKTSGTDLHYKRVPATGGILTKEKITSIKQLIEVIKDGNCELLTSDFVK